MKQPTKQLTPARLTALQITNDAFRAALERHPDLKPALLGRLYAPDIDTGAESMWNSQREDKDA